MKRIFIPFPILILAGLWTFGSVQATQVLLRANGTYLLDVRPVSLSIRMVEGIPQMIAPVSVLEALLGVKFRVVSQTNVEARAGTRRWSLPASLWVDRRGQRVRFLSAMSSPDAFVLVRPLATLLGYTVQWQTDLKLASLEGPRWALSPELAAFNDAVPGGLDRPALSTLTPSEVMTSLRSSPEQNRYHYSVQWKGALKDLQKAEIFTLGVAQDETQFFSGPVVSTPNLALPKPCLLRGNSLICTDTLSANIQYLLSRVVKIF